MNNPFTEAGYAFFVVRAMDPRLERERSRDGSCVNLSARTRNAKRARRQIHCPTHVFEALRKAGS